MRSEPDLSAIAALIGDPTRATVLSALLGGQALPAGELASRANVTPQTISAHLSKLMDGGLLAVNPIGRHRYYRLKNAQIAHVLETLAVVSPPTAPKSIRESDDLRSLRAARTCYDHLAGHLGVQVTQALLDKGFLTLDGEAYRVTPEGARWLEGWGIHEADLRKERRKFACTCLDWSERRFHLAGALGAAIAQRLFLERWIERIPGGRAVRLTEAGRAGLARELGIDL